MGWLIAWSIVGTIKQMYTLAMFVDIHSNPGIRFLGSNLHLLVDGLHAGLGLTLAASARSPVGAGSRHWTLPWGVLRVGVVGGGQ